MEIYKSSSAQQKILEIKTGGINQLHVVTDFDGTLTQEYNKDGLKQPSAIALIRQPGILSDTYSKKAHGLFDYYHPFEIDPNLSLQEKKSIMYQWWDEHQKLIVESGLTQEIIDRVSQKSNKTFRDNVDKFFEILNSHSIPVLIFSAGVGNIIDKLLEYNNLVYPNIYVVSNYYTFNSDGNIIAPMQIIHTFNKDETALENHAFSKQIVDKPNIILIGNSLGDVEMARVKENSAVLKIGFLDKISSDLELQKFREVYDIVITEIGDFGVVNEVLGEMVCEKE